MMAEEITEEIVDEEIKNEEIQIENISIENFKGIKKLEINNLKRFNVFIGKNDVGKSTLLESIFAFKPASLEISNNVLNFPKILRRSNREQHARKLSYNYLSDTPKIKISSHGEGSELTFANDHTGSSVNVHISFSDNERTVKLNQTFTAMIGNVAALDLSESFEWISQMEYFDSNTAKNLDLLEKNIGDANIVDDYDSDIERIQKISYSGDTTRLAIRKNNVEITIDDFGDGHKSALSLLALCRTISNSVLLLEEIESNHYPESLRKLITKLIEICKERNIQLFITTHSPEVLENFSKFDDVKLIHLKKTDDGISTNEILVNDYSMWRDIGWEITNYLRHEKIVIIEGEIDQIVLRHAFKHVHDFWPEEVGINFISAGGKGTSQKQLLKGLSYESKTIFYQTDLDKSDENSIKNAIINSFKELQREGTILEEGNKILFTHKLGTRKVLDINNILLTGDVTLSNIESHAIEDYLLNILLKNPALVTELGGDYEKLKISAKNGKEILQSVFTDYNSVKVVDIMKKATNLPEDLISIVKKIHN